MGLRFRPVETAFYDQFSESAQHLLVGTGLPFWLGTFVFVTVFVGLLDRERQQALGRGRTAQWSRAAIYGAAWSAIVTLSFQHIFLVRLP